MTQGSPSPSDPVEVEQVARIINPSAWAVMDGYLEQTKRKYQGQHVGWPADQFQHKESLATARQILAMLRPQEVEQLSARDIFETMRPCFHYAKRGTPDAYSFEQSETGRLLMKGCEKVLASLQATSPAPAAGVDREVLFTLLETAKAPEDWDGSWAMACSVLWARYSLEAPRPQAAGELGTRCKLCGTAAPASFVDECNRPECEYRAPTAERSAGLGEKWQDSQGRLSAEYDESDGSIAILWPDGRWLDVLPSGKLVAGRCPPSKAYPIKSVMLDDLPEYKALAATPAPQAGGVDGQETLQAIGEMMRKHVTNWPEPKKVSTAIALIDKTLAAARNPPKHDFWGAGEADCPREIKAGNGELHTLRCKRCGLDNPRDDRCLSTADAPAEGWEALQKAAHQFRFYEREHRAKVQHFKGDEFYENARLASNAAALKKAEVNREMAEMCEKALRTPMSVNPRGASDATT